MNMKLKNIITYSLLSLLILTSGGCVEEFLDFFPEDKMTPEVARQVTSVLDEIGFLPTLEEVAEARGSWNEDVTAVLADAGLEDRSCASSLVGFVSFHIIFSDESGTWKLAGHDEYSATFYTDWFPRPIIHTVDIHTVEFHTEEFSPEEYGIEGDF